MGMDAHQAHDSQRARHELLGDLAATVTLYVEPRLAPVTNRVPEEMLALPLALDDNE
jgi:hypothetical protein